MQQLTTTDAGERFDLMLVEPKHLASFVAENPCCLFK
jgi:hypothetical protein